MIENKKQVNNKELQLKMKIPLNISKTQARPLLKPKPITKSNLNQKKKKIVKETLMKLLKVTDEIFHSNPTIKEPVVCPTIYHEDNIVLIPLCIRCLLCVRDCT